MRFKATSENLSISSSEDETERYVRSIVRALVPRHARKVYLYSEDDACALREPGLVSVDSRSVPSNFLSSFRIIRRPGELIVVSGRERFTRDQWQSFAAELEQYAA